MTVFSNQIWKSVLEWIGISRDILNWEDEKGWVTKNSKGKSVRSAAIRSSFAESIYQVWSARNDNVFNGENQSAAAVIRKIQIHTLLRAQNRPKLNGFFSWGDFFCVFFPSIGDEIANLA